MRGTMSTFKVCTFYGFLLDKEAVVLSKKNTFSHRIEFIGDSDICAFGNEGKVSSAKNMFGLKGRMENAYNGYACITARMFNAESHLLAWSGKGVHSNAADWGPNMPSLWKNVLAARDHRWDMNSWIPDVVVINLGVNDLFPPASSETEIVQAYTEFLEEVRKCKCLQERRGLIGMMIALS
jgi:lysophospholipase L1-like esterase